MDIDIDTQTSFSADKVLSCVKASMVEKDKLKPHPVGVYMQRIPQDSITGLSAIPYKTAEDMGFFKLDFLHLSVLDDFRNKDEIRTLIKQEPNWNLMKNPVIVGQLFQLKNHFDIVSRTLPTSVIELADTIALIRPAKKHLLDKYLQDKVNTRAQLYSKPTNGQYYFKKGHAIAYALNIVLQLHILGSQ